jgi:hypothetical protein
MEMLSGTAQLGTSISINFSEIIRRYRNSHAVKSVCASGRTLPQFAEDFGHLTSLNKPTVG